MRARRRVELIYGTCGCTYPCSCVEFDGKSYHSTVEIVDALDAWLTGAIADVDALRTRLRREVDAHRMVLHPRALPFTDEEWTGYLAGIPGLSAAG